MKQDNGKNWEVLDKKNCRTYISSTSFDDMWANWFFGPLRAKNDPMIKPHPRVKHIANFWGISTITGRNIVKAMKMKNTPEARSKPKYIRDFPEGTLLVADWMLPGRSLTPFETLNKNQNTKQRISGDKSKRKRGEIKSK